MRGARPLEHEAVAAALIGLGAPGVQELDDSLLTFVGETTDVDSLRVAVARVSASAEVEATPALPLSPARWTARVGVQRLGAITVAPPWLAPDAEDGSAVVIIEPAMAFGTGEHPTTRGVLRLMPRVVRAGDLVADLGSGSGVLAIAAVKLGASRAAAIEIDPDAIGNTVENVRRNGVDGRVAVLDGDAATLLPLIAPVRVVLANIVSGVILALLPVIRASLSSDGQAILSGMLKVERERMIAELDSAGWSVEAEDAEDEWWSCVIATHR